MSAGFGVELRYDELDHEEHIMPRKKTKKLGRPKGSRNVSAAGATSKRLVAELSAYHRSLAAQCATIQGEMNAISDALAALGTAAAPARGAGRKPAAKRGRPAGRPVGRPPGRPKAAAAGGSAGRGRRPAGGSLKDYIMRTLGSTRGPVSVKAIAGTVKKSGYKSKSKNLGNQVSMALIELVQKRRVKKVGRGIYQGV